MKRTVITAALLAAIAMPALAGDATMKNDDSAKAAIKLDQTTTASTRQQSAMAPTDARSGMDGGCMHRNNTALNMM